ncbi:MAG: hypothetical protein HXX08_22630 [Chloroflexi bacterium]|uniref:Uncharacterized protein n=1 Tax=Candidatus Chlorohelix allophototropha TaxID=3003348 RepID=A0A8T7M9G3_9CHLR|nr:hypothetical protein [Chloroflexota bacterium]WJW68596.1 hypothetical protein OZ401_004210 [Chloroflexota bacterium L227-S17]
MRKSGITSLVFMVIGFILSLLWLNVKKTTNSIELNWFFLISGIVLGLLIAILLAISPKKPVLAGVIAIVLSLLGLLIFGLLLCGYLAALGLIRGQEVELYSLAILLLYFSSSIALFIGGIKSVRRRARVNRANVDKKY